MADKIKSGANTSEHAMAQSTKMWGIIAMILGTLTTIGATIVDSLGHDSKMAIIGGAVIATAGIVQKTLVTLGYISSRTEVKK